MKTSKKVSIVLPVYNGEDYVAESINSVIEQTYNNWELIIVNDCSTDNTLRICQSIAKDDPRIRIISNKENQKLPNSLNVGFREATGEYYTWTSDDNIYMPSAIASLVDVLEQNTDAIMVYSDYSIIDDEGNIQSVVNLQDPQYIVAGNVCGACFLYTAEIAKEVGEYDDTLFLAEDYDYWMRIYRHGRIVHINDNLYFYRRHSNSLTEKKKAFIQEQTYKALEKNFLPLYYEARKNGLTYRLFDNICIRAELHKSETKEVLFTVDKRYRLYLRKRKIKGYIKELIKSTVLYKCVRRMKGHK